MVYIDPVSSWLLRGSGSQGPIALMYHSISDGRKVPSWRWSLSLSDFCNHLDLLNQQGWTTACIRDMARLSELPSRTVFITFDDGYHDNYVAYQELLKRGMVATWFVVTGDIGKGSGWGDRHQKARMILSEGEIAEMNASGMEFGSHGCNHLDLTQLDPVDLSREVKASREMLEAILGATVQSFAYPYGRYDQRVMEAVKDAGYQYAATCRSGRIGNSDGPLQIHRLAIYNRDRVSTFSRKLAFGSSDAGWGLVGKYLIRRISKR